MAFENMDQAAEALAAAVNAPDGAPEPTPAAQDSQPETNQPVVEPSTTEFVRGEIPESPQEQESLLASKDIDLTGLSDDQREWLQAREREMQAVMTQRTQEATEARRQAEEATQFINELNTNPFFAQQVVQNLSAQLEAAGFTPAQAAADAQRQVSGQQQPQVNDIGFEDDGFEDDPYLSLSNSFSRGRIVLMPCWRSRKRRIALLASKLG